MEDRLIALETKVALGEDQIDTLNRTVYRMQEQLDFLQEQIRTLYRQMCAAGSASGAEPRDLREEIPPHY